MGYVIQDDVPHVNFRRKLLYGPIRGRALFNIHTVYTYIRVDFKSVNYISIKMKTIHFDLTRRLLEVAVLLTDSGSA